MQRSILSMKCSICATRDPLRVWLGKEWCRTWEEPVLPVTCSDGIARVISCLLYAASIYRAELYIIFVAYKLHFVLRNMPLGSFLFSTSSESMYYSSTWKWYPSTSRGRSRKSRWRHRLIFVLGGCWRESMEESIRVPLSHRVRGIASVPLHV